MIPRPGVPEDVFKILVHSGYRNYPMNDSEGMRMYSGG